MARTRIAAAERCGRTADRAPPSPPPPPPAACPCPRRRPGQLVRRAQHYDPIGATEEPAAAPTLACAQAGEAADEGGSVKVRIVTPSCSHQSRARSASLLSPSAGPYPRDTGAPIWRKKSDAKARRLSACCAWQRTGSAATLGSANATYSRLHQQLPMRCWPAAAAIRAAVRCREHALCPT